LRLVFVKDGETAGWRGGSSNDVHNDIDRTEVFVDRLGNMAHPWEVLRSAATNIASAWTAERAVVRTLAPASRSARHNGFADAFRAAGDQAAKSFEQDRWPLPDLQGDNPVADDREGMVEEDWAAWEIAGSPSFHDDLSVPLRNRKRRDAKSILFARLDAPSLDCGDALNRPTLVADDSVSRKTRVCH
jgi:hypothetical protein